MRTGDGIRGEDRTGVGRDARTVAARLLAWFFVVGGGTALLDAYIFRAGPALDGQVRLHVTVLSLADLAVAGIIGLLPWDRWHPRATLIPLGLAVILHTAFALTGFMAEPVSVAFMVVGFVWVGAFHGLGWVLLLAIPASVSYGLPLWVTERTSEIDDLAVILPVCVGIGLVVNRLVKHQHRAQAQAEHRAHLLQLVADSGRSLSQLDPLGIFDVALDVVHRIGFGRVLIETYDGAGVDRCASTRPGRPTRSRLASSRVPEVLSASPAVLTDAEARRMELADLEALSLPGVVAAPIRTSELLGAIVAGGERDGVHDTAELEALELLANQIGQALTVARVYRWEQKERRRHAEEATRDGLTGLGNRRAVEIVMDEIEPADAVVLLDLDHFKQVNDRFGHATGDAMLRDLGAYLRDLSRPHDHAARLGGDEFLLVLRQAGDEAHAAVERLVAGWRTREAATTMSAGFAVHREGSSPTETMARADRALYEAKRAGRDRAMAASGVEPSRPHP